MLAPIVLFVYNRFTHTQKTIESLLNCPLAQDSELIIYSDGAKQDQNQQVADVRNFLHQIKGFRSIRIIERSTNWGLARSVIAGVSEVLEKSDRVIVLEDDLIFSENFLSFMNECLEKYKDQDNIYSISGYLYPIDIPASYNQDVVLLPRASSWGWATWKDRWVQADWEVKCFDDLKKNKKLLKSFLNGGSDQLAMLYKQQRGIVDSWAIRWSFTHALNNAYGLFPTQSKVQNIGTDSSGTHLNSTTKYRIDLKDKNYILSDTIQPNHTIIQSLKDFFEPSIIRKIINKLRYGI